MNFIKEKIKEIIGSFSSDFPTTVEIDLPTFRFLQKGLQKTDSSLITKIVCQGNSMWPTLKDQQILTVDCKPYRYHKVGDIVVGYSTEFKKIICHRIISVKITQNDVLYQTKGDNLQLPDKKYMRKTLVLGRVILL